MEEKDRFLHPEFIAREGRTLWYVGIRNYNSRVASCPSGASLREASTEMHGGVGPGAGHYRIAVDSTHGSPARTHSRTSE